MDAGDIGAYLWYLIAFAIATTFVIYVVRVVIYRDSKPPSGKVLTRKQVNNRDKVRIKLKLDNKE